MFLFTGYDVPALSEYLDIINVMTYDFHGHWDKKTGHVAPMYQHPEDDVPHFNSVSVRACTLLKLNAIRLCFDVVIPYLKLLRSPDIETMPCSTDNETRSIILFC